MSRTVGADGRIYEFWAGRQRVSGKTTALRARVRWLARHPSVKHGVWVFDRLNEWGTLENRQRLGVRSCVVYKAFADYYQAEEHPRVVIWQLGASARDYDRVLAEAVHLGDVAIVLDEAYEYAEAGSTWTGSEVLRSIVFAGAHLPRGGDNELRPTHLLIACQYPKSVHRQLWQQAYTVMVGVLAGDSAYKWVRENFGAAEEEKVRGLKSYQWECVHGERPELPGYGPQG